MDLSHYNLLAELFWYPDLAYADRVKPCFEKVRASIDALEGLVDHRIWQLPKYRELVFLR